MTGGYSGGGGSNASGPWATGAWGFPMGIGNAPGRATAASSFFIVADTLVGFKTRAFFWSKGLLSNGIGFGSPSNDAYPQKGAGAGTTFIYVNNLVSPDYTGAVI